MKEFAKKIIRRSVAATIALAAATGTCFAAADGAPRYIFYFIGDGMGMAQVMNAINFNTHVLKSDTPLTMTAFPVASFATTYSANSGVTDSAAAGTALATGFKTKNSMLGMGPDTVAVNSIAKYLHDDGYGVALVTTVAIDDATPGAFYTHVPNRNHFYDTGRYLADSGYEFFAGASLRGTKDKEGNDNGLLNYIEQSGVSISYGLDGVSETAERVLVLNPPHIKNGNEIGYAIDSIPGAMTLPALTEAALKHLDRVSPDRFFMMVEGGSIDHGGHANDGGTVVREVVNFDRSLELAWKFLQQHPDETLIVVTADHETGGMSVGCAATGYSAPVQFNAGQRVSKDLFNDYCREILESKRPYTWADMEKYLRENLGFWNVVKLNDKETESLKELFDKIFVERHEGKSEKTLYASFNEFSGSVFRLLNDKSGFGWTTPNHTGGYVPVFAAGVGADLFRSMNDNTDLPRKIMQIAGLEMN